MSSLRCISCGEEVLEGYSRFACPSCGKATILRCRACRKRGARYRCRVCGFNGP